MLALPLVFVDIDTQRDFLERAGALYVPDSESIVPNLARLTEFARTRGVPVLATACAHSSDDEELSHFPPHCLIGTPGQHRVAATAWDGTCVLGRTAPFSGLRPAHLTLEKSYYDMFTHPESDRLVALYNRDRPTFVVYGVATDYCVRSAALGLLDRGCRVTLVVDAIRAMDRDREAEVLDDLVSRGATLALTEVICDEP